MSRGVPARLLECRCGVVSFVDELLGLPHIPHSVPTIAAAFNDYDGGRSQAKRVADTEAQCCA